VTEPVVLARCDFGPAIEAEFRAWETDGLRTELVSENDDKRFREILPEAAVVLHVLKPITAEVIEAAPRLRLIQKIGVGVNTIDLDAARRHRVAVCNMPGTNTAAVAEMAIGLMIAALRRIPDLSGLARDPANWALPRGAELRLGEVAGRTVGLVGAGAVASRLAAILAAMGAEVLYWNRRLRPEMPATYMNWTELLARADILSLHLPLTPETEKLLDTEAFRRMKPGAILVNTARGGLIDERALVKALDHRLLRAAALDVLAAEPPSPDNPLLRRDDVIVTPHVAWLTAETWRRSLTVARQNAVAAIAGRDLAYRVA
jgi:phosphoglycerate dehydrogenase-like enzyme